MLIAPLRRRRFPHELARVCMSTSRGELVHKEWTYVAEMQAHVRILNLEMPFVWGVRKYA